MIVGLCEYVKLSPFISFDLFVSPFISLYLGVFLYFHSSVVIRGSIGSTLYILYLVSSILVIPLYLLIYIGLLLFSLVLLLYILVLSILLPILVLLPLTMMIICSSGGFWENQLFFGRISMFFLFFRPSLALLI